MISRDVYIGALPNLQPNLSHNRHVQFETKTSVVRAFEMSYQLFHCAPALCGGIEDLCGELLDGELGAVKVSFPTAVRKLK